jgi:hypothetical protein
MRPVGLAKKCRADENSAIQDGFQLITADEIAGAVFELATNPAGRVMVFCNDQPRRLIPAGDPGYERAGVHSPVYNRYPLLQHLT